MGCLFIESVGGNAEGQVQTSKSAAHGDDANGGKAAPDHGEQLKAGHAGHVEVGENEVRNPLTDRGQCGEAV